MDKMRAEVESKLKYWGRTSALFALFSATGILNYVRPNNASENFADFFEGFQFGIAMVFLICAVYHVKKFRDILKSEEAIKDYYIKEHDERMVAIHEKTGGTVMHTCALIIVGVGIVAGYYNAIVFASLVSCGVFLLLVSKILFSYYSKNM